MRFIDLVKSRRSIRKFESRPIPREFILSCIDAARYAPSASNTQGWKFYIAEGKLKERLTEECLGGVVPNRFAASAPAIVVIAMKMSLVTHRIGARLRDIDYHEIDAGIAGEHFVLQATELGLGTCWIGWFNKARVRRLLGLPRSYDIPALIALGFPDEVPSPKERKKIEDICEFRSDV